MFHGFFSYCKTSVHVYREYGMALGTMRHIGFQIDYRLLQALKNGYVLTCGLYVCFWLVQKLAAMKERPVLHM